MRAERRQRKKYIKIIIGVMIALLGIVFVYSQLTRNNETLGNIRAVSGENKTAYYIEKDYNGEPCRVMDDYLSDGKHIVEVEIDKTAVSNPDEYSSFYDNQIPPNTLFNWELNETEYNENVDGYSAFNFTGTVITVVVPVSYDKYGVYGYGFTYVTDAGAKQACLKALNTVNQPKDKLPLQIARMPQQNQTDFNKYIKGWTKYER